VSCRFASVDDAGETEHTGEISTGNGVLYVHSTFSKKNAVLGTKLIIRFSNHGATGSISIK
jgi:hypothetical protein